MKKLRPACFLDRDGTLNIDHNYVHKIREWDWVPGVPAALKKLQDSGYELIVITNQSGVARGRFSISQVHRLHRHVGRQLEMMGIRITEWYVAPWHPEYHEGKDPGLLDERKPGTALFERAAREHQINLKRSLMVGDKASDLIPALELGIDPYLVVSRFMDDELRAWAEKNNIPVSRDLPEVVRNLKL